MKKAILTFQLLGVLFGATVQLLQLYEQANHLKPDIKITNTNQTPKEESPWKQTI